MSQAASQLPEIVLSYFINDSESKLPDLKGEFELCVKCVWQGMGRIATVKMDVHSVYNHKAGPVPGAHKVHEADTHQHGHHHHDHQHSSAGIKGSKEDPQHIGNKHNHSHGHSHNDGHSGSHDNS
jgi:hypothetical protein